MKILASGWYSFPHSFGLVNYEHVSCFLNQGHQVFRHDRPPLFASWVSAKPQYQTERFYADTFNATRIADYSQSYDLHIDTCVPPSFDYFKAACRVLFLVTEYSKFPDKFFDLVGGKSYFLHLVDQAHYLATPSIWSSQSLLHLGISPSKIRVIPHGVRQFDFPIPNIDNSSFRSSLGISQDSIIVCSIGTPSFNKGLDILLNALSVVSQSHKITLLYKGNDAIYGSQRSFKKLLNRLNLNSSSLQIKYIGSNLSAYSLRSLIYNSDIYASLFRAEGFNMPVAEAYVSGKYLVTTHAPPVTEFVAPDGNVYFVSSEYHTNQDGFGYFEPDLDSAILALKTACRDVEESPNFLKSCLLTDHIRPDMSWDNAACQYVDLVT